MVLGLRAQIQARADHEAAHYTALEQHFIRHLAPFGQADPGEEQTR